MFRPSPPPSRPPSKQTSPRLKRTSWTSLDPPASPPTPNVFGGINRKDYILETTGNGVAIFDYDGDGNDIFIVNGTRLNNTGPLQPPLPQLYRNEGNGHFKNVAAQAGFTYSGWGQGVCAGDYDNDGYVHASAALSSNQLMRLYHERTSTPLTALQPLQTSESSFRDTT